jgi:hypothetical protein
MFSALAVSAFLITIGCAGPDIEHGPSQSARSDEQPGSPQAPLSEPNDPPTVGATLAGEVVFEGEPPERKPVDMSADTDCDQVNRLPVYDQTEEINSNRTLKNVLVYAREGVTGTYAIPSEPVVLQEQACQLSPHVFGIQVGQPLVIVNDDASRHNLHAFTLGAPEFQIGEAAVGVRTAKRFDAPEVPVRLRCDRHPWMVAYAGVLTHPFFAVTDGAGTFEIKGLLPGRYVIGAWQETYGLQTQAVDIAGEELKPLVFTFRDRRATRTTRTGKAPPRSATSPL